MTSHDQFYVAFLFCEKIVLCVKDFEAVSFAFCIDELKGNGQVFNALEKAGSFSKISDKAISFLIIFHSFPQEDLCQLAAKSLVQLFDDFILVD